MKRLGTVIKKIRKSKGLSGKFVSIKLGIDPSTLSKYESNERRIDAELLPKLASILGVDVAIFFDDVVDETPIILKTAVAKEVI